MKQPTLLHLLSMAFMLTIMITSCTPTIPTPEPTLEPPTATIAHTDTNTPLPTAPPVLAPSGRAHVSIAYDSESDRIILYGGSRIAQTNASWGGTWPYDVKTNHWTEMNPVRMNQGAGSGRAWHMILNRI